MSDIHAPAFRSAAARPLDLVSARRGHFLLESGYHGALWLDLDSLFCDARRLAPFVNTLAFAIRSHRVSAVCGALLGGAFLAQLVARELNVDFLFTERVMPADASGLFRARYRLPAALASRVAGCRIAIVDDVMSAGSALRGTATEVRAHGGDVVVAGALLVLGKSGDEYFAGQGIPVVASARDDYTLWVPADCPLCANGTPLERP